MLFVSPPSGFREACEFVLSCETSVTGREHGAIISEWKGFQYLDFQTLHLSEDGVAQKLGTDSAVRPESQNEGAFRL
jgi:hypothetical protein